MVDPGCVGDLRRGRAAAEAFGVGRVGGVEHELALVADEFRGAVVNGGRGVPTDTGVPVDVVKEAGQTRSDEPPQKADGFAGKPEEVVIVGAQPGAKARQWEATWPGLEGIKEALQGLLRQLQLAKRPRLPKIRRRLLSELCSLCRKGAC